MTLDGPGLTVRVERVDPSLAALRDEHWGRLVGDAPDVVRQNRGLLLAYASAFSNEQVLASAWHGEVLAGIAVGVKDARANGDPFFAVSFSGVFGTKHCRSIWVTDESLRPDVVPALLSALVEHARGRGHGRILITYCASGDVVVERAASALGFARGAPVDDYCLHYDAPHTSEQHLAALEPTERRAFRRDMRRAVEAGARLETEFPATPDTLARAWPLVAELWDRKSSGFVPTGVTLFDALRQHMRPGDLGLYLCYLGDELVGCIFYLRSGSLTRAAYAGHRMDLEWKVHMAMLAPFIAEELEHKATTVHLGFTNDLQKRRLGAAPSPHVHYSLRLG